MDNHPSEQGSQQYSIDIPIFADIPQALRAYDQWVTWNYVADHDDNIIKRSLCHPCSIQEAYEACIRDDVGLAFVLTEADPFSMIELSRCLDANTGKIQPWAYPIIDELNSYTEVSNSREDIKIIVSGSSGINKARGNIAIHSHGLFISVTGNRWGSQKDIQNRQIELAILVETHLSPTWLEAAYNGDPGSEPEKEWLAHLLDKCLTQEGWYRGADSTELYPFLALCWKYHDLRVSVWDEMSTLRWTKEHRTEFIGCIEALVPKKEKKTRSEDMEDDGQDGEFEVDDDRPVIICDPTDITSSVDACIDVLLSHECELYQRDGKIVSVKSSPQKAGKKQYSGTHHQITNVSVRYIQEIATQAANWFVENGYTRGIQKYKPGGCPEKVVEHIMGRMNFQFPVLTGITTVPTIREDGSVITNPGYDESTGLYYIPAYEYPEMPAIVTKDDAIKSLAVLREPFLDFPFANSWHESAALAAILSIMSRHLLGAVPCFPITANVQGTGKSKIADVISLIATGTNVSIRSAPKEDDEMRKQLLVIAMSGDRVTLFDNVKSSVFGYSSLEGAITTPTIEDRILKSSEQVKATLQTVFLLTANYVKYTSDFSRRVIPITLLSTHENPEQRIGFVHKKLNEWVQESHPILFSAALNILRGYILAGKPDQDLPPHGSFEEWSDLVRSALVWAGCDDPNIGRIAIASETDTDRESLQRLLHSWNVCYPAKVGSTATKYKIKDVVEKVKTYGIDSTFVDLGECFLAYDPKADGNIGKLSHLRLSQRLPVNGGASRVIDGLRLRSELEKHTKTKDWWLEKMDIGESQSSEDTSVPVSEYDDSGLSIDKFRENIDDDLPF